MVDVRRRLATSIYKVENKLEEIRDVVANTFEDTVILAIWTRPVFANEYKNGKLRFLKYRPPRRN